MKNFIGIPFFILSAFTMTNAQSYLFSNDSPENILGERSIKITLKISSKRPPIGDLTSLRQYNTFNSKIIIGAGRIKILYSYDSLALVSNDFTKVGSINKSVRLSLDSPLPDSYILVDKRFSGSQNFIFPHTIFNEPDENATYISPTLSSLRETKTNTEGKFYYKIIFEKGATVRNTSPIKSFIMPKVLNVAVLGDSYSSGEGAPQTGINCSGSSVGFSPSLMWTNENSHRSTKSGLFQAVKKFAEGNKNIALVYKPFFLASTGAKISNIWWKEYKGVLDIIEDPQIKQLKELSKKYGKLDVIIISIGGNDIGFADAVESAIMPHKSLQSYNFSTSFNDLDRKYDRLNEILTQNCDYKKVFLSEYPNPTMSRQNGNLKYCGIPSDDYLNFLFQCIIEAWIEYTGLRDQQDGVKAVCDGFEAVAELIFGNNNEDDCESVEIFNTEFYEYWENEHGERCQSGNIINIVSAFSTAISMAGIENCVLPVLVESSTDKTLFALRGEIEYAHVNIISKLNSAGKSAVDRFNNANGNNNWMYINGNEVVSRDFGICNCNNSYFNGFSCSCRSQLSYQGFMHMNENGQNQVLKSNLFDNLQINLKPREKRLYKDTQCQNPIGYTPTTEDRNLDQNSIIDSIKSDELSFQELVNTKLPWIKGIPNNPGFLAFFKRKWANREFRAMRERTIREKR